MTNEGPVSSVASRAGSVQLQDVPPRAEVESFTQSRSSTLNVQHSTHIALLTGGGDKPYAIGIATALAAAGITTDFIGSDELAVRELLGNSRIRFFNLRGDQTPEVTWVVKMARVLGYYLKLMYYAATAGPKVFHILWNNKIEVFDRTLLMLYYRFFGKRLALTAHNVNAGKRDGNDSWVNRVTLRAQYRLVDRIFVHTEAMRTELCSEFSVPREKVTVIPFGINNTAPKTTLSRSQARQRFGLGGAKTLLFFGNIAPYKGLEYLTAAFARISKDLPDSRLIIAGRVKGCEDYWRRIEQGILSGESGDRVIRKIGYIPDEETEVYFKAADVLVLPYTHVFQSGVLFLGYSFGLPVIAADVGTLSEQIQQGQTGFVFKPRDSADLAAVIRRYFGSELFRNLDCRRLAIQQYANESYSWAKVAKITAEGYRRVLARPELQGNFLS